MFGIGGFEFFIIVVFAFLIIGPDKFPELAKSAGKFVSRFRSAKNEMDKVIKAEVYDPNAADPFQVPIESLQKMGQTVETVKSGETFAQRKARYEAQRAAEREAELAAAANANAAVTAPTAGAAAPTAPTAAADPSASGGFSPESLYAHGTAVPVAVEIVEEDDADFVATSAAAKETEAM